MYQGKRNTSFRGILRTYYSRMDDPFFRQLVCSICIFCAGSRSSHQRCSVKKGVLKNFGKFTGRHLCQSLFFNKFLRTPFSQNTSGRLLLRIMMQKIKQNSFDSFITNIYHLSLSLTLQCLVSTKMTHILKQTCSFQP